MPKYYKCKSCGRKCRGAKCRPCDSYDRRVESLSTLRGAGEVAPPLPPPTRVFGEAIICSDPHIPCHSSETIALWMEAGELLNIKTLIIGGDIIHADVVSRFDAHYTIPTLHEEFKAAHEVFETLKTVFSKIYVRFGNHDHRIPRFLLKLRASNAGKAALQMLCETLEIGQDSNPNDIATALYHHYLGDSGVDIAPEVDIILNDEFLIQHPATCSRVSPDAERKMAAKHRMSVCQGHNHLFGASFDVSGQDVVFNMGHGSDTGKFSYVRESPTTFPTTVNGFGAVIKQGEDYALIPLANHPKWFSLRNIVERLK